MTINQEDTKTDDGVIDDASDKKMKNYFVAYIDFLGTTEKINEKDSEYYLNAINEIFDWGMKENELYENHPFLKYNELKIRYFSDNLVCAIASDNPNDYASFKTLLSFVAKIQYHALTEYNWLLRGGVTWGMFYINENIVWGPALIAAHNLEDKVAVYPRIIIDGKLVSMLKERYINMCNLHIDTDGCYYLGYLDMRLYIHHHPEFMEKLGSMLKNDILRYSTNLKVLKKYLWAAQYHNMMCAEYYEQKVNDGERIPGTIDISDIKLRLF